MCAESGATEHCPFVKKMWWWRSNRRAVVEGVMSFLGYQHVEIRCWPVIGSLDQNALTISYSLDENGLKSWSTWNFRYAQGHERELIRYIANFISAVGPPHPRLRDARWGRDCLSVTFCVGAQYFGWPNHQRELGSIQTKRHRQTPEWSSGSKQIWYIPYG